MNKNSSYRIILIIIMVACFALFLYWGFRKEGYHVDEMYMYGTANSEYLPFMHMGEQEYSVKDWMKEYGAGENLIDLFRNLSKDISILKANGWDIKGSEIYAAYSRARECSNDIYSTTWMSGQAYKDYIAVSDTNRFNYISVLYNFRGDNHPPLYALLLHTICSVFPGVYSKWFGLGLNIVIGLLCILLLYKTVEKFLGGRNVGLMAAALYGLSAAAAITASYIRMYSLVTLMVTGVAYAHLNLAAKNWEWDKKDRRKLVFFTLCAYLSQYYSVIYIFGIAMACVIIMLAQKKLKNALRYILTMGIAGAVGIVMWPFSLKAVFAGSRGAESIGGFFSLEGTMDRLGAMLYVLVHNCLGIPEWLFLILVIAVAVLIAIIMIKDKQADDRSRIERALIVIVPFVFYFVCISKMAPYLVDRYIMCIMPWCGTLLLCGIMFAIKRIGVKGKAVLAKAVTGAGADVAGMETGAGAVGKKAAADVMATAAGADAAGTETEAGAALAESTAKESVELAAERESEVAAAMAVNAASTEKMAPGAGAAKKAAGADTAGKMAGADAAVSDSMGEAASAESEVSLATKVMNAASMEKDVTGAGAKKSPIAVKAAMAICFLPLLVLSNSLLVGNCEIYSCGQECDVIAEDTDCVYILPDGWWNESAEDTLLLSKCRDTAVVFEWNAETLAGTYDAPAGSELLMIVHEGVEAGANIDAIADSLPSAGKSLTELSSESVRGNTWIHYRLNECGTGDHSDSVDLNIGNKDGKTVDTDGVSEAGSANDEGSSSGVNGADGGISSSVNVADEGSLSGVNGADGGISSGVNGADGDYIDEDTGILSSMEDIALTDKDGRGSNYYFTYGNDVFRAKFDKDTWKIYDSYKINNMDDMKIICGALQVEHPVHIGDTDAHRTPEDMAQEWMEHNVGYALFKPDSEWSVRAKDVDLDPYDVGKSIFEIYEDRTGKKFSLGDVL